MMMQKVESKAACPKPTNMGHVDRVGYKCSIFFFFLVLVIKLLFFWFLVLSFIYCFKTLINGHTIALLFLALLR